MKDFNGNAIEKKNNELDWSRLTEIVSRGGGTPDWSHASSVTVDSNKNAFWTSSEDGMMICHVWGANNGKCNIVDKGANTLICTLSQPTSNTSGPNRTWIPIYAGRELWFQNNSNAMQAYFIPYK